MKELRKKILEVLSKGEWVGTVDLYEQLGEGVSFNDFYHELGKMKDLHMIGSEETPPTAERGWRAGLKWSITVVGRRYL